jgi:hypothetical protein
MKRVAVPLVIALLVLAGIHSCQSERRIAEARSAVRAADSLRVVAKLEATVALAQADSLRKWAVGQRTRDAVTTRRIVEVRAEPLPPSCDSACQRLVATRDTIIDSLTTQRDGWRRAFESQAAATARLAAAYNQQVQATDSLSRAVKLLEPQRRDLFGRLLHPEVRPVVFAGLCVDGRPCAGVGVALAF